MSILEAVILGVIQGITEFFPVSSSGHLVMTERVLGLHIPGILFEIAVHVATLVSVLIVYRQKIWSLLRGLAVRGEGSTWPYAGMLVVATIPAAVLGLAFKDWFEARFEEPIFAGTMVLVTGCVVWSSRWVRREGMISPLEFVPVAVAAVISLMAGTITPFLAVLAVQTLLMGISRISAPREWQATPTWGSSIIMGIAQSIAILPGISRSGSTVISGLWRRLDPVVAAEFSFLMSIPAIIGAAILSVPDALEEGLTVGLAPLIAGGLAAAIAGILAISFFVALLRKQNFHVFAYYCWVVGAAFVLWVR